MNISGAEGISAMQAAMTQQKISIAVLSKAMDVAKTQGQAAVALLEGVAETGEQIQSRDDGHIDVTA